MARCAFRDVEIFLTERGYTAVDRYATGSVWAHDSGVVLTLPEPVDGWLDADVVDRIFSDRWVWSGPTRITRYNGDPGS